MAVQHRRTLGYGSSPPGARGRGWELDLPCSPGLAIRTRRPLLAGSLAETIDLTAHARSDHEALDEIMRVLRAPEWRGADIAELVRLTGRDTADPVTRDDQIDWR